MTDKNRMLTAQEIADYMGVHKKTVLNWIEQNKIPAFRFEKTYRVTQEEFDKFLSSHTVR